MTFCKTPSMTQSLTAHPIAKAASIASVSVGFLVLVGWEFDIRVFKNVLPDMTAMSANAALDFVLLGMALWLSLPDKPGRPWSNLARAGALAAAFVVGATTASCLVEYAFRLDLGLNELFFGGSRYRILASLPPGRMSPFAAASFLMLATAILLLRSTSVFARRVVQLLIVGTVLIATLALVGYAYGYEALNRIAPFSSMAVHTAATLLLLGVGVLYTRSDFELTAPLRSTNTGGILARQMLPAILGIPLLLGWVRLVPGQELGEFGFETGVIIHTTTTIIVFAALVWLTARSINEIDAQRELARQAESEMRVLAEVDPLTGALNRRSLHERLEREWSRAMRHDRPLSAIMLDVDFFKQINDRRGHAAGDAILQSVALLLLEQCRPMDLICRYGGDEFCVILPETEEAGAIALAERFCARLADTQTRVAGQPISVTGSFGVATRSETMHSMTDLIDHADRALLGAKQAGRNRVFGVSCLNRTKTETAVVCVS